MIDHLCVAWSLPLPDNAGLVCYRVGTGGPPALSAIVLVNTMGVLQGEGPATHMRVAGPSVACSVRKAQLGKTLLRC